MSRHRAASTPNIWLLRVLILITSALGVNYVVWRWTSSVHWSVWPIAVPLVIAETYSLLDSLLFGLTVWRLRRRPAPPAPPADLTVDVFVMTYNEPVELLRTTVRAARAISYPHRTWILDDGNRPTVRAMAAEEGIEWITRSDDWTDRPRHAKAGNFNSALLQTSGEFLLILDADQVAMPQILDRTLGYFSDPQVGFVQTQQFFGNVPESDPLGSQAPLFYGPIQQGKDAWNAGFFCGSNAILRREALMRMGISRYVIDLEHRVRTVLSTADKVLERAMDDLAPDATTLRTVLVQLRLHARRARASLAQGVSIAEVTYLFQQRVAASARVLVEADRSVLAADVAALQTELDELGIDLPATEPIDEDAMGRLSRRDWSPLAAIEAVRRLVAGVDVDREDEAQPLMPMSVISVTEDMSTGMRLHGNGWTSVYHDETLAIGLAPEDLGTAMTQRLRWAQGTIQVMLRENPLVQKSLSLGQRLMYFATMWSYLSGFAALVYIAAPISFLMFGVLPVKAMSSAFFARLIPFLLFNQLLFFVVGRGRRTWRGQQYALALFPVWIRSVTSAVGNVVFGRSLAFAVTPKEKQQAERTPWHLIRPQLIAMGLLSLATVVGLVRWAMGLAGTVATGINVVWVVFDLCLFWVLIPAVRYRGFEPGAGPASIPGISLAPVAIARVHPDPVVSAPLIVSLEEQETVS